MIMAGYRLMEGKRTAFYPAILAIVAIAILVYLLNNYDINVKSINTSEDVFGITLASIAVGLLMVSVIWSGYRAWKVDKTLEWVMIETAKTTSLVFIILLGAAMLTAAFRAFGGEELVRHFLSGLPGGFYGKFVVVMAVIFVLGFFLDFIEIAVVVVPIISPILLADPTANVTAVWLGVMIGVNMQTSFLTPPFGFALFYLRGVAPPVVKTIEMYKGVVPFIMLQLFALGIVGFYPSLVNYLPNRVYLTSETAPPPQNPRLQLCLEEHLFTVYDEDGQAIRAGIDKAGTLDVSYLPEKLRKSFVSGLENAGKSFDMVAAVRAAQSEYQSNLEGYEPLHRSVRDQQKVARIVEAKIAPLERRLRRLSGNADSSNETIERLKAQIEALRAETAELKAQVPANWEDERKKHLALEKAETTARRNYRRNVDGAYEPVKEILTVVGVVDALAALDGELRGLATVIENDASEPAMEKIKAVSALVSDVAGASAIRSKLSKARRAMRGDEPDREKAMGEYTAALEIFDAEVSWRKRAATELLPGLNEYNDAIKGTIGVRLQQRLTNGPGDHRGGLPVEPP